MGYNIDFVSEKLNRWKKFLEDFSLPDWDELPGIGLYMDQVVCLLTQYLEYLPPTENSEAVVTANAINNYVRLKAMPAPEKKKYGRLHLAYLIMICTLKNSLSISYIQKLLPPDLCEADMRRIYSNYVRFHKGSMDYFISQVESVKSRLWEENGGEAVSELVYASAIWASFAKLMSEKILDLRESIPTDDAAETETAQE